MKQGLVLENGQVIRYSEDLAKVVLNYEQAQAIELLIQKYMSNVLVIPTGSGGYRKVERSTSKRHPSSEGH